LSSTWPGACSALKALDAPLVTAACHEDLTATDLVGRYLLSGDATVWQDGPLTRAVRSGAICYLDEIVEARKDTTVVIHSLTDHRRVLPIEKTGELLDAHPDFLLVISYNPRYQSVVKDLKPSTRQRWRNGCGGHGATSRWPWPRSPTTRFRVRRRLTCRREVCRTKEWKVWPNPRQTTSIVQDAAGFLAMRRPWARMPQSR